MCVPRLPHRLRMTRGVELHQGIPARSTTHSFMHSTMSLPFPLRPSQVLEGLPEDTPEQPEIPKVKGKEIQGGPQMLQLRWAGSRLKFPPRCGPHRRRSDRRGIPRALPRRLRFQTPVRAGVIWSGAMRQCAAPPRAPPPRAPKLCAPDSP